MKGNTSRVRHLTIILLTAVALLLLFFVLRVGGSRAERDPVWARIQRDGVLRVGMDASYPPFELLDASGAFSGYDVDLASALAKRWGVRLEIVNVHFDGLYDALGVGKCDVIISALPYDRNMTRDVRYSRSYFNAGLLLVAGTALSDVEGVEDLDGHTVAVELGAESHQELRRLVRDKGLEIEIHTVREADELLPALTSGVADAAICDPVQAQGLIRADTRLRVVGEPLTDEPYVIAVVPEAEELLARINEALAEWEASGYLEALAAQWF